MPSSFVMGRRVRSSSETVSGTVTREALSRVRKEEFCSERPSGLLEISACVL